MSNGMKDIVIEDAAVEGDRAQFVLSESNGWMEITAIQNGECAIVDLDAEGIAKLRALLAVEPEPEPEYPESTIETFTVKLVGMVEVDFDGQPRTEAELRVALLENLLSRFGLYGAYLDKGSELDLFDIDEDIEYEKEEV